MAAFSSQVAVSVFSQQLQIWIYPAEGLVKRGAVEANAPGTFWRYNNTNAPEVVDGRAEEKVVRLMCGVHKNIFTAEGCHIKCSVRSWWLHISRLCCSHISSLFRCFAMLLALDSSMDWVRTKIVRFVVGGGSFVGPWSASDVRRCHLRCKRVSSSFRSGVWKLAIR